MVVQKSVAQVNYLVPYEVMRLDHDVLALQVVINQSHSIFRPHLQLVQRHHPIDNRKTI